MGKTIEWEGSEVLPDIKNWENFTGECEDEWSERHELSAEVINYNL